MKQSSSFKTLALALGGFLFVQSATAATITFRLDGNGGAGLLPGNEVGTGAEEAGASSASGGLLGNGVSFDDVTNVLSFNYFFSDLTGGFSATHLHSPGDFNTNAAVIYNLNSDVTLGSVPAGVAPLGGGSLVQGGGIDSSNGSVTGSRTFSATEAEALLDGLVYINVHSTGFGGGELWKSGGGSRAFCGLAWIFGLCSHNDAPSPLLEGGFEPFRSSKGAGFSPTSFFARFSVLRSAVAMASSRHDSGKIPNVARQ